MRVDTISQDDETGHNMMTQCDECNIWNKMTQHNTRWWTHNRKDEYIHQIGVEDILDLLCSTFNCMPFNFVMTHYWYRWYRATECLAAIHGVFEIESIWIINNSPSHSFRDSDREEYLPIETYPSIGIHCTEDSRHHLEKDSAFTTLYGSKTLSNCPQSTAPNPLFSTPQLGMERTWKRMWKRMELPLARLTIWVNQPPAGVNIPLFLFFSLLFLLKNH